MRNFLCFLFLTTVFLAHSQIVVKYENNSFLPPNLNVTNPNQLKITFTKDSQEDFELIQLDSDGQIKQCEISGETKFVKELGEEKISLEIDCNNKIVKVIKNNNEQKFTYCAEMKKFLFGDEQCKTVNKLKFDDITEIPIPIFNEPNNDELEDRSSHRFLLIDAHPNLIRKRNNSLYKLRKTPLSTASSDVKKYFQKANSVPVNGSISVFIRNYNLHNLDNLSVSINGADYSFNKDISYLVNQFKKEKQNQSEGPESASVEEDGKERKSTQRLEYLKRAYNNFSAIQYLNINDVYVIEAYKNNLVNTIQSQNIKLSTSEEVFLSKILNWYPAYISLSPISMTVPDGDEVSLTVSIKNKGSVKATDYLVGQYKTSGGLGFSIGSMIYATNLKDNEIYTETDSDGKLFAKIDSTNQLSIGIGLNSEIYFRTGSIIRPTLNLGAFVPFDEDLTPFLTLGPGLSIINKTIKFSLSGGLTYGKINDIVPRFKGKDLSGVPNLTNDSLGHKVWKDRWYLSVGVFFNLAENKK